MQNHVTKLVFEVGYIRGGEELPCYMVIAFILFVVWRITKEDAFERIFEGETTGEWTDLLSWQSSRGEEKNSVARAVTLIYERRLIAVAATAISNRSKVMMSSGGDGRKSRRLRRHRDSDGDGG